MTNELNHQIAEKQPKKRREAELETAGDEKKTRLVRLRLLPIWLRIIIVAVLFIIAAVIGIIFGYSVIGEGNAGDALKWETWKHILDIMNGTE